MPIRKSKKLDQVGSARLRYRDRLGERLRLGLSDDQLIAEAILVNHADIEGTKTLDDYRRCLVLFSEYLRSPFGEDFYTARRRHVLLFMAHLEKRGGKDPDNARLR